jgi:hypothetical protein
VSQEKKKEKKNGEIEAGNDTIGAAGKNRVISAGRGISRRKVWPEVHRTCSAGFMRCFNLVFISELQLQCQSETNCGFIVSGGFLQSSELSGAV